MRPIVETVVCGAYQENAYLVYRADRADALLVDPGDDPQKLLDAIRKSGKTLTHILITHGHFDHTLGAAAVAQHTCARVYASAEDAPMLLEKKRSLYDEDASVTDFAPVRCEILPETEIEAAGMRFAILKCPGHTPGGVSFYDAEDALLFTGDTLFVGGYGRTDFEGGSFPQLRSSLRALLALPPETAFYPGHGAHATIGHASGAQA